MLRTLDDFTVAYIECMLWSTNDESTPEVWGEPLGDNYGPADLSEECLSTIKSDCAKFQEENAEDITVWPDRGISADEQAGHDFWLTRNGHGCGFWDGDWPEEEGNRLDKASQPYGEVNPYVGDDGKIYC